MGRLAGPTVRKICGGEKCEVGGPDDSSDRLVSLSVVSNCRRVWLIRDSTLVSLGFERESAARPLLNRLLCRLRYNCFVHSSRHSSGSFICSSTAFFLVANPAGELAENVLCAVKRDFRAMLLHGRVGVEWLKIPQVDGVGPCRQPWRATKKGRTWSLTLNLIRKGYRLQVNR